MSEISNQTILSYKLGSGKVITKIFTKDNVLHCDNGPAVYSHDSNEYYQGGVRHRDRGPAVFIKTDNYIRAEWWKNGVLHRLNKPAIVDSDGTVEYWEDGFRVIKQ
jgi:hypothetical protein